MSSPNVFDLGQSSHWFSRPGDVILKRLWETMFRIKRDAYYSKLNSLRTSFATSFDLDQFTILSFWNEILYLGKNIVGKEDITCNKQFVLLQQYFLSKGILILQTYLTSNFLLNWINIKYCYLGMNKNNL